MKQFEPVILEMELKVSFLRERLAKGVRLVSSWKTTRREDWSEVPTATMKSSCEEGEMSRMVRTGLGGGYRLKR